MRICLFGTFTSYRDGHETILQLSAQRLIALVTLRTTIRREEASGLLWPDVPDGRAAARLRTTLWRLGQSGSDVLTTANGRLRIRNEVEVDYRNWVTLALRIIDRPDTVSDADLSLLRPRGELLPGWYDDWALLEQERVRQLQLHVLEVTAEQLLRQGRHAAALEFALGALRMEYTRESAHRLVITVHLAEGNVGEALRQYERCEHVLRQELGISPSGMLEALLAGHTVRVAPRAHLAAIR